jgi:EmrB/QacA subfamily drug resistance transporter
MTRMAAPPTSGVKPEPAQPGGLLTHRQIMTIISGLMLGMFLAALDQTIVSTAIRTIADNLKGLDLQAWATTSYLITSTIATPLYGKLSDLYGRKPFFLTAISIFLVGSIACTFAQSMYELAVFRAVQGLGAGGLMSLALAILGDIVPPRQRAKYTGYFMSVFGLSSVVGPVVGGFLAGQQEILNISGWRWVFLVNVPIGAIALFVVAKVLNVPHTRKERRIDWFGAITISVCLVPLLIVAEQGQGWGWTSRDALICYGIGAVGLVLFLVCEKLMKDDALIPLKLFRSGVFSVGSIAGVLIGMAMFGGIVMIPQYLQIVHGATPTRSGLLMLPFVGGLMISSMLSGLITGRTGRYKIFPLLGTLLITAGALLFHYRVNADTPLWQVDVYMAVISLGLGNCMQTLTVAVQNAVPATQMGVATSTATFTRQMGGTIGVAVFLSILFSTVTDNITNAFRSIVPTPAFQAALHDPAVLANPDDKPVLALLQGAGGGNAGGALQDSSFIQRLDPRLARPFLVGFSDSMETVFLGVAAIAAVSFLVLLFLKEIPLRSQSGLEARAAEDTARIVPAEPEPVFPQRVTNGHVVAQGELAGRHRAVHEAPTTVLPALRSSNGSSGTLVANPLVSQTVRGSLRRADGQPVNDAVLTLIDLAGHQVGRGHSGPDGSYQIHSPGAGTYVLIASAAAHQPEASMITIGETGLDHDVVLNGSSELTGVVSVAGGQEPIAGAVATLADARGEVIGTQVTSADGRYRFAEIVSGNYTLAVSAPAFRPTARTVAIPDSGEVHQDVELAGSAQVRGSTRTTMDDRPVPDARVTLLDADGRPVATTVTDQQGEYTFLDVPEGDYTIVATGYPAVTSNLKLAAGQQAQHDVQLGHGVG